MDSFESMLKGEWYLSNDAKLIALREKAHEAIKIFNEKGDQSQLKEIMGQIDDSVELTAPIFIDYGCNTYFGQNVYLNTGVTILDSNAVKIGDNVLIGPNVGFYTPSHPLNAEDRRKGLERSLPIIIEDDVWIGASAVILGGVIIKKGAVIGAGSVVIRDVEENTVVAGNPAKVIKRI